jgi:hypothetical protein
VCNFVPVIAASISAINTVCRDNVRLAILCFGIVTLLNFFYMAIAECDKPSVCYDGARKVRPWQLMPAAELLFLLPSFAQHPLSGPHHHLDQQLQHCV